MIRKLVVRFFVAAVMVYAVLLVFWDLDKLEGADFKYDINLFKFQSKNIQREPFGPNLRIFIFAQNFTLEGTAFKYDNNISNLQPKITQIRNICLQAWKIIVLHKILVNDIFKCPGVKCDNSSSKFKPANNPKAFYPKFNVLLFLHENLFWKVWGCWQ